MKDTALGMFPKKKKKKKKTMACHPLKCVIDQLLIGINTQYSFCRNQQVKITQMSVAVFQTKA